MYRHLVLIGLTAARVLAAPPTAPGYTHQTVLPKLNITRVLATLRTSPGYTHQTAFSDLNMTSIPAGLVAPRSETAPQFNIPISRSGCSGRRFDTKDEAKVGHSIKVQQGRTIGHGSIGVWVHGTAAWYVCNCKFFWTDTFPVAEYEQARAVIADKCGVGNGGWLYSDAWKKGYVMDNSAVLRHARRCHSGCQL